MSDISNLKVNNTAYNIKDSKARGIVVERELSPAISAHAVGEYIRYEGVVYKVKSAISVGDTLVVDTNIEANDLPDDTTIYTPGLDEENFSEEISSIVNVYGSKNLLPRTDEHGQYGTGITWTEYSDGSLSISGSVATGYEYESYNVSKHVSLKAGTYIFSGVPENLTGYMRFMPVYGQEESYVYCVVGGTSFTLANDITDAYVQIVITGGTYNNARFYPMIRDARITDATYVPYAMTNRELTERVESSAWRDITSQCTFNTTDLAFFEERVFDNGFAYLVSGLLTNIQNISDVTAVVTLPRNSIVRSGQSGVTVGNAGNVEDVRVIIGISPNVNTVTMSVGNWSATGSRNFIFSFLVPHV